MSILPTAGEISVDITVHTVKDVSHIPTYTHNFSRVASSVAWECVWKPIKRERESEWVQATRRGRDHASFANPHNDSGLVSGLLRTDECQQSVVKYLYSYPYEGQIRASVAHNRTILSDLWWCFWLVSVLQILSKPIEGKTLLEFCNWYRESLLSSPCPQFRSAINYSFPLWLGPCLSSLTLSFLLPVV